MKLSTRRFPSLSEAELIVRLIIARGRCPLASNKNAHSPWSIVDRGWMMAKRMTVTTRKTRRWRLLGDLIREQLYSYQTPTDSDARFADGA